VLKHGGWAFRGPAPIPAIANFAEVAAASAAKASDGLTRLRPGAVAVAPAGYGSGRRWTCRRWPVSGWSSRAPRR